MNKRLREDIDKVQTAITFADTVYKSNVALDYPGLVGDGWENVSFHRATKFGVPGSAEALTAVGQVDGKTTLIYAARGTDNYDKDGAAGLGQAWRAEGLRAHYELHKPWIDAAIDYANGDNGIEQVIFTGHSLGGSMADMFMAYDAQYVDVDTTVVTFGSAGLHPDLFRSLIPYRKSEIDSEFVKVNGTSVSILNHPDYIGIAHSEDPVYDPSTQDRSFLGVAGHFTDALTAHLHPEGRTYVIDRTDIDVSNDLPFKSDGPEHGRGQYLKTINAIASDPALAFATAVGRNYHVDAEGSSYKFHNLSNGRDYIFGGDGVDKVFANGHDDIVSGGMGADDLYGGDGNDVIHGGTGNDHISGGNGRDSVSFAGHRYEPVVASHRLTFDLESGWAYIELYDKNGKWLRNELDHVYGVELVYATNGNDVVEGNFDQNLLRGYGGNDYLNGRRGVDTLIGDDGDDVLIGGLGADVLRGGSGIDTASYEMAAARVTASLTDPTGNEGDAAGDSYDSVENLHGSRHNDVLEGDAGANRIEGRDGVDKIRGRGGDDTIDGGEGDDAVKGGGGDDRLIGGAGHDGLKGGDGRDRLRGGEGDDHLGGGDGRDKLLGGRDADVLRGGSGNDVLKGGGGDDEIEGGRGRDLLWGGNGSDDFVFGHRDGKDVIRDFDVARDEIDLSGLGLGMGDVTLASVNGGRDTRIEFEDTIVVLDDVRRSEIDDPASIFIF